MRALHFNNIKKLTLSEQIRGSLYFIYLFFRPVFLKLNKLNIETISQIKDIKDIKKLILLKHPRYAKFAEYTILLKIIKSNLKFFTLIYENLIFYKSINSFKTWYKVYKINKKFKNITIKDELFL